MHILADWSLFALVDAIDILRVTKGKGGVVHVQWLEWKHNEMLTLIEFDLASGSRMDYTSTYIPPTTQMDVIISAKFPSIDSVPQTINLHNGLSRAVFFLPAQPIQAKRVKLPANIAPPGVDIFLVLFFPRKMIPSRHVEDVELLLTNPSSSFPSRGKWYRNIRFQFLEMSRNTWMNKPKPQNIHGVQKK